MVGKVKKSIWNVLMLLKWEAKLAHWSGTKWTDSMFYITTDWKSIMNREKWKSKKETNILSLPEIREVVKNIWNFIFRLFLNSWGVHTTLRKILDTLDEKPQGNNLSKLGTLKYEFPQLWHSAMFESHTSFYFYPLCVFKCHAKSASALIFIIWNRRFHTDTLPPKPASALPDVHNLK